VECGDDYGGKVLNRLVGHVSRTVMGMQFIARNTKQHEDKDNIVAWVILLSRIIMFSR
jgi:hypothetical protein